MQLIKIANLATTAVASATIFLPHVTGAFNHNVTQRTISRTICVSNWTDTVRPPVSYTQALKKAQIRQYGYSRTDLRDYEEDHLIPLSLGGSPASPKNLWPEPRWNGQASLGDIEESALHRAVCDGKLKLAEARRMMRHYKLTHG